MIRKSKADKQMIIRDSTLREGEDVVGVNFSLEKKLKIAKILDKAQVPEIEVVAPGKVFKDLEFVKRLKEERITNKDFRSGVCLSPTVSRRNRGNE